MPSLDCQLSGILKEMPSFLKRLSIGPAEQANTCSLQLAGSACNKLQRMPDKITGYCSSLIILSTLEHSSAGTQVCTTVSSNSYLISLLMEVLTKIHLDTVWQGNTAGCLACDMKGFCCFDGLLNPCLNVSVPVC